MERVGELLGRRDSDLRQLRSGSPTRLYRLQPAPTLRGDARTMARGDPRAVWPECPARVTANAARLQVSHASPICKSALPHQEFFAERNGSGVVPRVYSTRAAEPGVQKSRPPPPQGGVCSATLRTGQSMLGIGNSVNVVYVKVIDIYGADAVAKRLSVLLNCEAKSWSSEFPSFVTSLQAQ